MMKLIITTAMLIFLTIGRVVGAEALPPLTIDEAVSIALQKNPRIEALEASVEVMQAKLRSAQSVLYPQIEFRFIIPFIERESGVFIDQLIWDFWRTPSLIKASKALLESTRFDRSTSEKDLALNTKIAYYTTLSRKHARQAAQKSVAEQEARLARVEGFFKAGRGSNIDLARAKVDLGASKLAVINADNGFEIAKAELATLMGLTEGFAYELVDALEYNKININLENSISNALLTRPELQSLRAKEVGFKADLLASKNNLYFPQVLGRAAYRFEGKGATGPDFIAGLGVRFPLFTGLSHLAGVSESSAKLKRIEADIEASRGEIALEIKRHYLNLKSAQEAIGVMELSKYSAEETLKLAKERYRLQRGSNLELAEAEALAAQVEANLCEAIYSYKIAVSKLERATGEELGE